MGKKMEDAIFSILFIALGAFLVGLAIYYIGDPHKYYAPTNGGLGCFCLAIGTATFASWLNKI